MSISQKAASLSEDCPRFDRVLPRDVHTDNPLDHALEGGRKLSYKTTKEDKVKPKRLSVEVGDQVLALYDEYRPRLFRYIRSMNLNRDQIEEVIQETFLRLTTQLLQQEDIENAQGWIVRVAHNVAVDVHKRNGRTTPGITDLTPVFENRVDPLPNPEEVYSRKEQIGRMETALSAFSPQHRRCFSLRAEGFRYKDIGQVFGISEQRAAFIVKQVAVRLAAICD